VNNIETSTEKRKRVIKKERSKANIIFLRNTLIFIVLAVVYFIFRLSIYFWDWNPYIFYPVMWFIITIFTITYFHVFEIKVLGPEWHNFNSSDWNPRIPREYVRCPKCRIAYPSSTLSCENCNISIHHEGIRFSIPKISKIRKVRVCLECQHRNTYLLDRCEQCGTDLLKDRTNIVQVKMILFCFVIIVIAPLLLLKLLS